MTFCLQRNLPHDLDKHATSYSFDPQHGGLRMSIIELTPQANSPPGQLAGNSLTQAACRAISRCAARVSLDRPTGRLDGLRKLLRSLWPAKASLEFSIYTGASIRHAERVLAGQRGLSLEHVQALLWSEHGLPVLRELMRGCREEWWLDLQAALEMIDLERRQAVLRRELSQRGRDHNNHAYPVATHRP